MLTYISNLLIIYIALTHFEEEKYAQYNRCIWYHVQSLHAIDYEDYNYQEITEVLSDDLKRFVSFCSRGTNYSVNDLMKLGNNLGYSLKVFVSIIVMEAKLQSELLFALEAVIKHMEN